MKILRKAILPFMVLSLILGLLAGCAGQSTNIQGATVNSSGHLILTLSGGATEDAGYVLGPTGATGPQGSAGQSISVSSLINNIGPSLVYVDAVSPYAEDVGTGIIIGKQGYILTAYHVITGASTINVTLSNGTTTPATVVTGAQGRDWAVLKMSTVPASLQIASLGSSSAASVGDFVIAGGFALGYTPNPSFSYGIISAFRTLSDGFDYVQTNAAINAGDSGGPLLNLAGQVIGINDQVENFDDNGNPVDNMGYCIPISDIQSAIQTYVG